MQYNDTRLLHSDCWNSAWSLKTIVALSNGVDWMVRLFQDGPELGCGALSCTVSEVED